MFGFVEILLLIGAFHGFFLGSILAFKQNGDHAANRLFAALLLITSWQLFLTALSKSGVLVQVPHLAGMAFPFMFLVGPLYYNMQGQRVRILVDAMRGPGDHMVVWNTNDTHEASLSSGVYLYKLAVGDRERSRTILFVRDSETVW